jgi:hypothetical protein
VKAKRSYTWCRPIINGKVSIAAEAHVDNVLWQVNLGGGVCGGYEVPPNIRSDAHLFCIDIMAENPSTHVVNILAGVFSPDQENAIRGLINPLQQELAETKLLCADLKVELDTERIIHGAEIDRLNARINMLYRRTRHLERMVGLFRSELREVKKQIRCIRRITTEAFVDAARVLDERCDTEGASQIRDIQRNLDRDIQAQIRSGDRDHTQSARVAHLARRRCCPGSRIARAGIRAGESVGNGGVLHRTPGCGLQPYLIRHYMKVGLLAAQNAAMVRNEIAFKAISHPLDSCSSLGLRNR